MTSLLIGQIPEDPAKVVALAKTISEQSLASILVLVVLIFIASMAFLVWYFVKQAEKNNDITRGIAAKYSEDAASSTNAINNMNNSLKENTNAMRENTNVMQRFRDKIPVFIASIFASVSLLTSGCAGPGSTGGWTVERFAVLAKSVATEASIIHLKENPQHRQTIELVVEQLNISIAADLYTPARLAAILKPLGIRELAGREGRIAIAGTIVIYDLITASVDTTADPKKLKPIFEGIRDGFQAALDATK